MRASFFISPAAARLGAPMADVHVPQRGEPIEVAAAVLSHVDALPRARVIVPRRESPLARRSRAPDGGDRRGEPALCGARSASQPCAARGTASGVSGCHAFGPRSLRLVRDNSTRAPRCGAIPSTRARLRKKTVPARPLETARARSPARRRRRSDRAPGRRAIPGRRGR